MTALRSQQRAPVLDSVVVGQPAGAIEPVPFLRAMWPPGHSICARGDVIYARNPELRCVMPAQAAAIVANTNGRFSPECS